MVVTRSKSVIKTNSLTKTKLGSLGSLSSLSERADVLDTDLRKSLHASRSVDTDLDAISNEGNLPTPVIAAIESILTGCLSFAHLQIAIIVIRK
jgi:hypothetical protein